MGDSPYVVAGRDVDRFIEEFVDRVAQRNRLVLGVAGPPGSGKSTLAQRVVELAAPRIPACVAPMDGFHRSNEELAAMGLLELKGVPASFDPESFVKHLELLRDPGPVAWPTFDRHREQTVPGGQLIASEVRLVVVEGNYLLVDQPPWNRVRELLDEVWYLDVPEDVLVLRLQARHERAGTPEEARTKVESTDLPNARLVATTRPNADVVIAVE